MKGATHATLQGPQQAGPSRHPISGAQYLTQLPNQPSGPLGCGCCGCRFSKNQGQSSPLLDMILFPAMVGATPQTETSKYDQPNTYLRKLAEKYPYMYNILRSTPPEELIAKVYKDRMITTYQADYCKMGEQQYTVIDYGEQTAEPFDNLIRAGGMHGTFMLDVPILLPDCSYRPQQRRIFRPNLMSKLGCVHKESTAASSSKRHEFIPQWKSEYMDTISKLGNIIVRDKLHQHGGSGPGRK
ncbi:hypothetical protein C0J52_12011 [Blattella germanica]|nr:hypothetical protein C0J52_12011 [Blattella germanica]